MKKKILKFGLLLSVLGLTACGGGGGSSGPSGPVTSTLSFPLNAAQKSLVSSGGTKTFAVSGDCTGTGNLAVTPATTPVTVPLLNVPGFSAVSTVTATLTNCGTTSLASTSTTYYDTNYNKLGYDEGVGKEYGLNDALPVIPANVKVGDTGVVGTTTKYLFNTDAFNGTDSVSYVIEADTVPQL